MNTASGKTVSQNIHSQDCRLDKKSIPFALNDMEKELLGHIIESREPIQKGELICSAGEQLGSLFIVLSGSFKGCTLTANGHEQLRFVHFAGDIIGLDGIGNNAYRQFEIALETSEVYELPLDKLDALSGRMPALRQQMKCVLSNQIYNAQVMSSLLSIQSFESRIATLFHHLDQRQQRKSFSTQRVRLSMSHGDIANYLNLPLGNFNELLTRFQDKGLISLQEDGIYLIPQQNWNDVIQA